MIGHLDLYWTTNPDWLEWVEYPSGKRGQRLKSNAPPEAHRSFQNYVDRLAPIWKKQKENPGLHII